MTAVALVRQTLGQGWRPRTGVIRAYASGDVGGLAGSFDADPGGRGRFGKPIRRPASDSDDDQRSGPSVLKQRGRSQHRLRIRSGLMQYATNDMLIDRPITVGNCRCETRCPIDPQDLDTAESQATIERSHHAGAGCRPPSFVLGAEPLRRG